MKIYIRAFGLIIAAFSVISFFQALFDVGLTHIAREMIDYYRAVVYLFLDMPARLFDFHFPSTLMDMWALSFVGAGAYVGTSSIDRARFFRRYPGLTKWKYWRIALCFILGISGLGLLVLLAAISPSTYIDDLHEEPLDMSKGAALNAIYILATAVVFFILNGFGPSI